VRAGQDSRARAQPTDSLTIEIGGDETSWKRKASGGVESVEEQSLNAITHQ
jgi:hypothetical protein